MKVKGTIVEKQYYVIEVEVPDGARPSEQAEAIWDAFYERNSTGVIEPDDMDLDGSIYDMVIIEVVGDEVSLPDELLEVA